MFSIKGILREPLLHFVVLGCVLFAIYSYTNRDAESADSTHQIYLTPDQLLQMTLSFESQWRRPPTQEEFGHLLEGQVQQEVLYREALAMGLDKDDTIVKRRMAQKMQFLAEDVAAAREPSNEELRDWYAQNSKIFAMPGRVSFRQIYFSPDRRGNNAQADAAKALAGLSGQGVDSPQLANLGDSIMLQDYFGDYSVERLAKEFGPEFAQTVMALTPGSWQGPIPSGLGWHLVFVDFVEPGRIPDLSEIEADVRRAWLAQQKDIAWQKAYEEMRAKYTILLPASDDSTPQTVERALPELSTEDAQQR
ncbi:MAG: peptidylprolyl isomerase [Halioglobus sp.]